MTIKTNATDRKSVVKALVQMTGEDSIYLGPPTFAYHIGAYTVDRNGAITTEEDETALKEYLGANGLIDPELAMSNVVVPIPDITPLELKNLIFLIHSKQYLLNRVVGHTAFSIPGKLIEALEQKQPEDMEEFHTLLAEHQNGLKGLAIAGEAITFSYPMQQDATKNSALTELMENAVAYARAARRVNPKLVMEENEKYYLRSWLLRVGFSGPAAQEKRKALLEGLNGHTAFRTPADEAKWKAARAAEKQAKESDDVPTLTPEQEQAEAVADAALIEQVNASFDVENPA